MEAKLQKLKVTELKELLGAHNLPQTGKKDELVKRLVDAGVNSDASASEAAAPTDGHTEELVELDDAADAPAAAEPAPATESSSVPSAPAEPSEPSEAAEPELTPDQLAMKRRAERFGVPFVPNPRPKPSASKPAAAATAPVPVTAGEAKAAEDVHAKETREKKEKPAAIDRAPLGISDEVLARRAAKFGLPEKKVEAKEPAKDTKEATKGAKVAEEAKPKEAELTPEKKEQLAAEEEKKRKRAEKFGAPAPAAADAPDAKKVRV
ncbi:hypothetical protein Q5752_006896 [Cryptotrichosporon argae]